MAQGEGRVARQGAGGRYTWLWMIVAVLMVAGFMGWLALTTEPTTVVVVEEDEDEGVAASTVTLDELETNAAGLQDREIRLVGVTVASRMGTHAFWIDVPGRNPYLVKLRPELVAGGLVVENQGVLDVVGRVHMMSDSVLTAWEQEGAIVDPGQRAEAEFAPSFLEVHEAWPQKNGGSEQGGAE